MSDSDKSGEDDARKSIHPRDTMDDITEVTNTEELSKKNTTPITKRDLEIRSATLLALILGAVVGMIFFVLFFSLIGMVPAALIMVGITTASPFLFVPRNELGIKQNRIQKWARTFSSRNAAGELFFVNSTEPEDLESTDLHYFRAR